MSEQAPRLTSLHENIHEIFDLAMQDGSEFFTVGTSQWEDGRTVETIDYTNPDGNRVQLSRPGIDTADLADLEEDTEHSGYAISELSLVMQRRYRIQLADGNYYASTLFYVGNFKNGASLLLPSMRPHPEQGQMPYVSGWLQKPLQSESEYWLQDLIAPKPPQPL